MGMRFKSMHDPGNASRTGHKTPGPASYKVGQDRGKSLLNSRGPAYTMGTRPSGRRQRVGDDTGGPGPGEYTGLREAGDSWGGEQKGFSLGKRLNRNPGDAGKRASGGPGPAKYNLRTNRTQGPSFTMGGGGRSKWTHEGPGPGEYNVAQAAQEVGERQAKYTIAGRANKMSSLDMTPGPCEYSPKEKHMGSGKAYSLTGRNFGPERGEGSNKKVPGPGHYAYHEKNTDKRGLSGIPAYSMGTRIKKSATNLHDTPGPKYRPDVIGPKPPAYSLQFRKKEKLVSAYSATPGPGENEVTTKVGGPKSTTAPAFTMASKLGKKKNMKAEWAT